MKTAESTEYHSASQYSSTPIQLPLGLLGFESIKNYLLLASPEDEPFLWLQMADHPNHAFLVISPSFVLPSYQPDLTDEDVAFLGLSRPEDALLFNIATVRQNRATVNLKGPVVLNRHTLVGKQVIPVNASQFSLQHVLPFTP